MPPNPLPDNVCTIPCNLCGAKDVEVLGRKGREGEPLRTVICRGCGLVWSDPPPIEPRRYYEEEYRKDYKRAEAPRPVHVYRAGRVALDRWRRMEKWVPRTARLLDIGSGGGEFVYLTTQLGLRSTGIEPNRGYARYSIREYGIDVREGFVSDWQFGEGEFDAAAMWHVLEHMQDPASVFARVRRWLKPGGVLVVEVPNVEAVCMAPSHRFHRAHLYNFNTETLAALGRKNGFVAETVELSSDGGNITAVFRAASSSQTGSPGPENCRRILTTIHSHTWWTHYLSRWPYTRPVRKLLNALEERRATNSSARGGELLDSLFRRAR